MLRRQLIQGLSTLALLAAPCWCSAADTKVLNFVVPSAAGGSPDVLSRVVSAQLAKDINRPVIIENKPGAAGNIGILQIIRGNAQTVGYGNINTLAVNRALFTSLPYDVERDLVPVSHLFNLYNVLIVSTGSDIHSVQDLINKAKSNPGQMTFGAAGVGTTGHMGGELLKHLAKIDTLYVPYQGGPAALQDLLGGRLHFMLINSSEAMPLIQGGKVRALGVSSLKRLPQLPDVPTIDEAGVKNYEVVSWGGVVGNKNMPPAQAAELSAMLAKGLKTKDVQERMNALGAQTVGSTPQEFAALIDKETKKWRLIIESAKIEKLN